MSASRVIVVGGGPVGMFQALSLSAAGFEVTVLERRTEPRRGSRSIGIHPPSLEALADLGLAESFVAAGVKVHRARAMGSGKRIGTVDFAHCQGRFPYVLTLPQQRTEALLSEALEERLPGSLARGVEVTGIHAKEDGVCLETSAGAFEADWVVACDGRHSRVRELLGIGFDGHTYAGTYAMEDHPDETPFGCDAVVFLEGDGLVESFPLPGGVRRWVARTDGRSFRETVRERTGFRLLPGRGIPNVFRAERGLATRLAHGRVVLGGDAAHVVSPIGGQGMNLGWMGAGRITRALQRAVTGEARALARDAKARARMARAAARRAEINMWLGRPTRKVRLRAGLVGGLLRRPLVDGLVQGFTMRGLRWGV